MAKYIEIKELYEKVKGIITSSPENWSEFLDYSARFYKYNFSDACLLFAQNKNATACASMEIWNQKMNCWINKGSHGIALIEDESSQRLRYVFDVLDVTPMKNKGRLPNPWRFDDSDVEDIISHLTNEFYEFSNGDNNFVDDIISLGRVLSEDLSGVIVTQIEFLYPDIEKDTLRVKVEEIFSNSFSYTVLSRLGLEKSLWQNKIDLSYINTFARTGAIEILGESINATSMLVLNEIGKVSVKNRKERQNVEKTSRNDRDRISQRGRLHDSQLSSEPRFEDRTGVIRGASQGLPQGEQISNIPDVSTQWGTQQEMFGSGGNSEREAIHSDRPDGDGRGDNERIQTERSDRLGSSHELNQSEGTRDSDERDNQRIESDEQISLLPSLEEQLGTIITTETALTNGAVLNFNKDYLSSFLRSGSNKQNSIQRIYLKYLQNKDKEEIVEFLKEEYTNTFKGIFFDGVPYAASFTPQGAYFCPGERANKNIGGALFLTYEELEFEIRTLIEEGNYIHPEFAEQCDQIEKEDIANDIYYLNRELPEEIRFFNTSLYPDCIEKVLKTFETESGINSVLESLDNIKSNIAPYEYSRYLDIYERLKSLQTEYTTYPLNPITIVIEDFLTQDEIDFDLKRGSGFEDSKARIYKYFKENHTAKEKADFLKNEYGIGGRSTSIYRSWHDAKGISLEKNIISLPTGKILIKWSEVAKRIDKLISNGEYISKEEIESFTEKEREEEELVNNINLALRSYISFTFGLSNDEVTEYINNDEIIIKEYNELGNDIKLTLTTNNNNIKFYVNGAYCYIEPIYLEDLYNNETKELNFDSILYKARAFYKENKNTAPDNNTIASNIVLKSFNIGFSEHPCFYGIPVDNVRASNISFALGNKLLGVLDTKVNIERDQYDDLGGYYKTDFNITFEYDGEEYTYEGRYDLGDGETDLINHIRRYNEYKLDPKNPLQKYWKDKGEDFYNNEIETATIWLKEIIPYLESISKLSEEDDLLFDEIMSTESDWWTRKRFIFEPGEETDNIFLMLELDEYEKIEHLSELYSIAKETPLIIQIKDINYCLDILHAIGKTHHPILSDEERELIHNQLEDVKESILDDFKEKNSNNYVITNDNLGEEPKSKKIENNINAIKLLKELKDDDRLATDEEKEVLAKYAGWGGLPEVFEHTHSRFKEIKDLLSEEDYYKARSSTLNAHFTSPIIIKSMYNALIRMGFKGGNILEPSMGIGNFFGMLPNSLKNSNLFGIEIDNISGEIAKYLYPDANIFIEGFEKADEDIKRNFFDVVIGNVPFGEYSVHDPIYNKNGHRIHDYFINKSIDKTKPGGIVAVITSKGTMDKYSPLARKEFAEKAELVGAIRLPNDAFKKNAGTEVTSDILFFKKRERPLSVTPNWINREVINGIDINSYFVDHPEMILGDMKLVKGPYGLETTCVPFKNSNLSELLEDAILNLGENIISQEIEFDEFEEVDETSIPAPANSKNYSFIEYDGDIYYRKGSSMRKENLSGQKKKRVLGLINLRDITREIISMQLNGCTDEEFNDALERLNNSYDSFISKFDYINSSSNQKIFDKDESYYLLSSLENFDSDNNYIGKPDFFTKRTIRPSTHVTHVDTAHEALALSLANYAKVNLEYMSTLTDIKEEELIEELKGVIFSDPGTHNYITADEYLSGNVREKLKIAKEYAEKNPEYLINVNALTEVQPEDLTPEDIDIRLGATWIPERIILDFVKDIFKPSEYLLRYNHLNIHYSSETANWQVEGKNNSFGNALVQSTYGTSRMNGYKILENALNLRECKIYDVITKDGVEKKVLNSKETTLATQKKEELCDAFREWVYEDLERREFLCELYNEKFNSIRPREYSGDHLSFPGMNYEIEMKPYQKNAIARQIYGGNSLLAHCVGAGKTYEMIAASMEMKRLGLSSKSLFVVPNSLVSQWASEFMRLYPNANILAAGPKDLSAANRKRFCARIATGDYDAIIIPQSQFSMIPLSADKQIEFIQDEIDRAISLIDSYKRINSERFTVKQMEKTRKRLEAKLNKLMDSKKDDVVTFEELGVDRLFIDESHNYKNLSTVTKLGQVPGITTSEAKKSEDLLLKCKYLNEKTGNKGVIFATGTPISNSMTELYTNMRYLEPDRLKALGLDHFDSWASTFGEIITAIELSPEGGYRSKRRFAKFHNLPELMALFKEIADIQTADSLNLNVPNANYETLVLEASEVQKDLVQSFSERADKVRNKLVDPSADNMLKITTDGRKAALDQRIINSLLPESSESKTNFCANKVYDIYKNTSDNKGTQLIFSDLATPNTNMNYNVYDDIKNKLISKGIPENEIAFIHDYETPAKKEKLFNQVNNGEVRVLLGSTVKLGTGTNVQTRLVALHHLDVPWRPSDIEQREGRIIRQGNLNDNVSIYKYVTKDTFDSYSWQTLENKQKFIGQVMTSKSPVRSCSDIDETALSYAEIKALAAGNPLIKEKMELDIEVSKLKLARASHEGQKYKLQTQIAKDFPERISRIEDYIRRYTNDLELYNSNKPMDDSISFSVKGQIFDTRKDAGEALLKCLNDSEIYYSEKVIGEFRGFKVSISFDSFNKTFKATLSGSANHTVEIGTDPVGITTRIINKLEGISDALEKHKVNLSSVKHDLESAKQEVTKPFLQEEEYRSKNKRLHELNSLLEVDKDSGEDLENNSPDQTDYASEDLVKYDILQDLSKMPNFSEDYCIEK